MNRLGQETSPYLLQHKDNPVDWYPWSEEALERSVLENKPILLSIGYSACHWCHVMEHESFENEEIASIMNKNFVCIKVDREERPDLDHIYQNVAQALTRSGGWPLTVFLTPARRPFFGGTYFPPEDQYGRPGFKRVLQNLSKAYQTDPMGVAKNAMKLTAYIEASEGVSVASGDRSKPDWKSIDEAASLLLLQIDWENGGMGGAPKFPSPMIYSFLWRYGVMRNHDQAKAAALLTLRKMAMGGIYDHLGGGFSRYSVDSTWSVPHFEKMLYDNGLLLKLYSEVLLTENSGLNDEDRELFLSVVSGSASYLLREMRSEEGGFYAAQDADSEGEEGKFFVWDLKDIAEVLPSEEDQKIFALRFGITDEGNFEHGKTVLYLAASISEIAETLSVTETQVQKSLEKSQKVLFEAREKRIRPGTDDQVLTSWNGLLISGLAWASQAIRQSKRPHSENEADDCLLAAEKALSLIMDKMSQGESGKLLSTFKEGQAKLNGYLDDYAFLALCALDLCRFTLDESLMLRAQRSASLWMKRILRHFKDEKQPGYFFTSDDHEELIHRPKTIFDQAIPSGAAVIFQVLQVLAETDTEDSQLWSNEVEKQLSLFWPSVAKNPYGCGEMLSAALLLLVEPWVVSGPDSQKAIKSAFVFRRLADKNARSSLLVCRNKKCGLPLANLQALEAELSSSGPQIHPSAS